MRVNYLPLIIQSLIQERPVKSGAEGPAISKFGQCFTVRREKHEIIGKHRYLLLFYCDGLFGHSTRAGTDSILARCGPLRTDVTRKPAIHGGFLTMHNRPAASAAAMGSGEPGDGGRGGSGSGSGDGSTGTRWRSM